MKQILIKFEDYKIKLKGKEEPTNKAMKKMQEIYHLKKYTSRDDLESDNETEIYYDLEYDNTPYILKESSK